MRLYLWVLVSPQVSYFGPFYISSQWKFGQSHLMVPLTGKGRTADPLLPDVLSCSSSLQQCPNPLLHLADDSFALVVSQGRRLGMGESFVTLECRPDFLYGLYSSEARSQVIMLGRVGMAWDD